MEELDRAVVFLAALLRHAVVPDRADMSVVPVRTSVTKDVVEPNFSLAERSSAEACSEDRRGERALRSFRALAELEFHDQVPVPVLVVQFPSVVFSPMRPTSGS